MCQKRSSAALLKTDQTTSMHALTIVVCLDFTLCTLQPDKKLQAGAGANAENCLTTSCEFVSNNHISYSRQE